MKINTALRPREGICRTRVRNRGRREPLIAIVAPYQDYTVRTYKQIDAIRSRLKNNQNISLSRENWTKQALALALALAWAQARARTSYEGDVWRRLSQLRSPRLQSPWPWQVLPHAPSPAYSLKFECLTELLFSSIPQRLWFPNVLTDSPV